MNKLLENLTDISLKVSDIAKMADAIERITWDFNSDDKEVLGTVSAVNGVASGIAAISREVDDKINAMEKAECKARKV